MARLIWNFIVNHGYDFVLNWFYMEINVFYRLNMFLLLLKYKFKDDFWIF